MNIAPAWFTTLSLCALLCCVTACDDDSGSTEPAAPAEDAGGTAEEDDSHGGSVACTDGPGLTPATPDLTEDDTCSLEESLEGTAFIVNGLILSKPEDGLTLGTLNPLWEQDITDGRLMLLFKVVTHDLATGAAIVRAGSGCANDDGGYEWHVDPSDLSVQVTGCHFETTEPATLSIWPGSMNKAVIVSDLSVAGHFTANGSDITGAFLEGALAREDAVGLVGQLGDLEIPILDFFEGAGIELDMDLDGDGIMDAWAMAGDLSAESTEGASL